MLLANREGPISSFLGNPQTRKNKTSISITLHSKWCDCTFFYADKHVNILEYLCVNCCDHHLLC